MGSRVGPSLPVHPAEPCAPLRLGQCFPSFKMRMLRNSAPLLQLLGVIRAKIREVMEGLGLGVVQGHWGTGGNSQFTLIVANSFPCWGDQWEKKKKKLDLPKK